MLDTTSSVFHHSNVPYTDCLYAMSEGLIGGGGARQQSVDTRLFLYA